MTRKRKIKHRRKNPEELVPIDGETVRAAIELRELSVNAVSVKTGIPQSTLDSIVNGRTKRCYESVRTRLARLLRFPADFLGGETDLLESEMHWIPYPGLPHGLPYIVDENFTIHPTQQRGNRTLRKGLPPRYQIVSASLAGDILNALKRDVAARMKDAQALFEELGSGHWKGREWDRAAMLLHRLLTLFWWRRFFTKPIPLTDVWEQADRHLNGPEVPPHIDDAERFALSAADALRVALAPWLEGLDELHYGRFAHVLWWASTGFGVMPGEEDAEYTGARTTPAVDSRTMPAKQLKRKTRRKPGKRNRRKQSKSD